jgi:hypothetical protein
MPEIVLYLHVYPKKRQILQIRKVRVSYVPIMAHLDLFIESRADLRLASPKTGQTLLHVVAARDVKEYTIKDKYLDSLTQLFKVLVEKGLDPYQGDTAQRTALDVAASLGNQEVLDLFARED